MSEETIFREVDEELRRDRLRTGWRRFGPLIIGAAVGIVLLVAANEGWAWWQNSNAARSSDQFYAALDLEDGGDLVAAQKALDGVIASGTGQYPVLGKFKQAGLLARQGKKDEALAAYDALANSESNPRLKSLALLLAANFLVDKGDVAGVKARIQGLLAPDEPLRNSARETLGLAQYKAGDLNGARDSFEAVVDDPTSPDEARGRMQLFIAQLVAQGATPPATASDASTAGAAAAAAVQAIGTGAAAPANDNATGTPTAPTADATSGDATGPAGVESSQPATPDAALGLATPAPAATAAAPGTTEPVLSTGAGLPTPDASAPPAATAPATTAPAAPAPAATLAPATPAPATTAPAAASPAAAPAPAATLAPATQAPATTAPAAASPATAPATPAPAAPSATGTPAPATGTTGK